MRRGHQQDLSEVKHSLDWLFYAGFCPRPRLQPGESHQFSPQSRDEGSSNIVDQNTRYHGSVSHLVTTTMAPVQ